VLNIIPKGELYERLQRPISKPKVSTPEHIIINYAIYPYVPRPEQFQQAIASAWTERHPDVEINLCDYDCYSEDPPADLDVFGFDFIFLDEFVSKKVSVTNTTNYNSKY